MASEIQESASPLVAFVPQAWEPPKGIWFELHKNRPARPFVLRWKEAGKIHSQSFPNEQVREKTARSLAKQRAEHGKEVLTFDPREWRRWLEFKDLAGDVDPLTILREWRAGRQESGIAAGGSVTVKTAVTEYLAYRAGEKLSRDTKRHHEKHLAERFVGNYGAERLACITHERIEEWLNGLTSGRGKRKGKPMEPVTRKHHLKDVARFFAYCVSRGWVQRNPCDLVPMPQIEEEDVELLTVEEGRLLFSKNKGQRILPRLALEAFGFLRASSAGRIKREHVDFDSRGIRMPGAEHKSRKTKFRQGHPDNLWQWLKLATDDTWAMAWWEYRNEKRDAFVRAGIARGSENRLRKTCLSSHLAWKKTPPLTSYLAQHTNMATTEIYLGVMTEAAGKAWFEIAPNVAG